MDIMNMTVNDVILLNGLVAVAKEAREAAQAIQKAYAHAFGIGQDRIEVWSDRDGYNHEYLTHSGIWQARYLHQTYDVTCTEDEIYRYLRAEYMIREGFASRFYKNAIGSYISEEGELETVAHYLHGFINRAKKLAVEQDQ